MFRIGSFCPGSNVMAAPMAGITGLPYRMLARSFGCGMAFSEMINARSLSYGTKKTGIMLATCPEDRPLGIQLLGSEEKYILRAMDALQGYGYDVLDLNCACPQKKIVARNAGSALLKDPLRMHRLLKRMVAHSSLPVTVKIRLGWDSAADASDIARYAEDAGVSALAVHGRTKQQGYRGLVDYAAIGAVRKAVSIPLIASGDIFTPRLAKRMFDDTGCDAVMVARGGLGNPWIFRAIETFLDGGRIPPLPSIPEVTAVMKDHLARNIVCFGETDGVKKFRKFFIWYTRGFAGVKDLRNGIDKARTEQDMTEAVALFRERAEDWRGTINFPAEADCPL